MTALLKIVFVLFACFVTLPVLAFLLLTCLVYEGLRALWVGWCWWKESGK